MGASRTLETVVHVHMQVHVADAGEADVPPVLTAGRAPIVIT